MTLSDDDAFGLFDEQSPGQQGVKRSRLPFNGYEIALWAVAVALIAAGIVASLWAYDLQTSAGAQIGPANNEVFKFAQLAYMFASAAFTAGLIAGVVAIGLRAFLLHAGTRAADMEALSSAIVTSLQRSVVQASSAPEGVALGTPQQSDSFDLSRRSSQGRADNTAFMRPND